MRGGIIGRLLGLSFSFFGGKEFDSALFSLFPLFTFTFPRRARSSFFFFSVGADEAL